MSLIKVSCTYCEAILEEESTLRASVCPDCGRPYLLEEAARFYKHHDFEIRNGELVKYYGEQPEVELPAFVASIGENAFLGNVTLKRIVIPEGVLRIGRNAFAGCSALESVEFPDSLDSIGDGAFSYCTSLTDVVIPWRHLYIGEDAFSNCTAFSSMTTRRGAKDDNGDGGMSDIAAGMTDDSLAGPDFDDAVFASADTERDAEDDDGNGGDGASGIPAGMIEELARVSSELMAAMDDLAELSSKVDTMIITSAQIGKRAFAGCTALQHVCIMSGEIGDGAFAGCTGLKSVNVGSGEIGDGAFAGCAGLEIASIVSAEIGKGVFEGCSSLEDITLPE